MSEQSNIETEDIPSDVEEELEVNLDDEVERWTTAMLSTLREVVRQESIAGRTIQFSHGARLPNEPPDPITDLRKVGATIILEDGKVWAVEPVHSPGVYLLPKGATEDSESLQAGAVREVLEETGFLIELTSYVMDSTEPGRCVGCRKLAEFGYLPADHPGCHRRYYTARRLVRTEPHITDTGEVARVLLVDPAALTDPADRMAVALAHEGAA